MSASGDTWEYCSHCFLLKEDAPFKIFLNTHFMNSRKQSDRDTKEQICAILGGCGSTFFLAPFCANGTPGQLPA